MAFLTRLSPLVQASSRMQFLPTTSTSTSSTYLRLLYTSPTSTIRLTCPMAKAPTMSQVKIFCENNAIVWQSAPGWSWRSRDPEETGQGVKEIITKISYQLFGLRWTCILSKRQKRGTRRGLKCTGAGDFNFCCDAQAYLYVFAGRFFRRKDWLIAGICFGLVRWLFTIKVLHLVYSWYVVPSGLWYLCLHHICDPTRALPWWLWYAGRDW